MIGIGLKMLFADRAKVFGLVLGVAFSTLLITQQSSLFVGLMLRTQSLIADAQEVNLWVMDPTVEFIDSAKAMRDVELQRVRGVPGVAWAVPFFRATTALRTQEGRTLNVLLIGLDDNTLIGMTHRFVAGGPADLHRPDAVAIDYAGFKRLWPDESPKTGRLLELNDHRAVVTEISDASEPFSSAAVIYTRYSKAISYFPSGRNQLSFVLARAAEGYEPQQVAREINARTGLKAYTSSTFSMVTMKYYFTNTGIPLNFAVVIALGFVVGAAIVALIFNMFVSDNIRQFATLKALGATDRWIIILVSVQAGVVGAIGYGIGLGVAAAFVAALDYPTSELRGFYIPWWVALGVAASTAMVILIATLASSRRVVVVDPAIVFRG